MVNWRISRKPILCLEFDGVLHSYSSGWQGATEIPDKPVPGAFEFIRAALEHFDVQVFSSRSKYQGGIEAMKIWFHTHNAGELVQEMCWPTNKPPAFLTIDDRAIQFIGTFQKPEELLKFKPWNKKEDNG